MENTTLQMSSQVRGHGKHASLAGGMGWGLIGGLAGTMAMDVLLMASLWAAGIPFTFCFSLVGDTIARFISILGGTISGGIPTGIVTHYLIGSLVGILFGTLVVKVPALRVDTMKKCIIAAILYIEILSQPLLAMAPLLVKLDRLTIILWYGGSLFMHLILAIILGSIVGGGLHLKSRTKRRS